MSDLHEGGREREVFIWWVFFFALFVGGTLESNKKKKYLRLKNNKTPLCDAQ